MSDYLCAQIEPKKKGGGNKNTFSVCCLYTVYKIKTKKKNTLSGHNEQHPKEGRQQYQEIAKSGINEFKTKIAKDPTKFMCKWSARSLECLNMTNWAINYEPGQNTAMLRSHKKHRSNVKIFSSNNIFSEHIWTPKMREYLSQQAWSSVPWPLIGKWWCLQEYWGSVVWSTHSERNS